MVPIDAKNGNGKPGRRWTDDLDDPPAVSPATIDEIKLQVGPRDSQEHSIVTASLRDKSESQRVFLGKPHGRFDRLVARVATAAGVRSMFDHTGKPCIDGWIYATAKRLQSEADARAEGEETPQYNFSSLADLLKVKRRPNWLVEGLIKHLESVVEAGVFKACKTTIGGAYLSVCLAAGRPFLGCNVPKPVKALLMSPEAEIDIITNTVGRISEAENIPFDDLVNLKFCPLLPNFSNAKHLKSLTQAIEENDMAGGVILFDSIYRGMRDVATTSVFAVGGVLDDVASLCIEAGVTPIFIHHLKKVPHPYSPPTLHQISGAGFAEFARQWLLWGRREPFQDGSGIHRLWLVAGGSAGHSGRWKIDLDEGPGVAHRWAITAEPVAIAPASATPQPAGLPAERPADRSATRLKADAREILAVLRNLPAGETVSGIRDAAGGMPAARVKAAIAFLVRRKRVVACEISKPAARKKPFPGYVLAKSESTQKELSERSGNPLGKTLPTGA